MGGVLLIVVNFILSSKDVSHVKALSKGGKNKDGLKVVSKSKNRSFKRNSKSALVSETSTREKRKSKKA